ncbi:MAG TPA: acyl-CoA dehydrogenase [Pseudomonadales bacterium]|nr:acyl-CoA dehydrogenase [Gammaproteobacteria bacterium]HIL85064.1 acyl-CoA dehydrogenase [Pseudomonadales bacterium]
MKLGFTTEQEAFRTEIAGWLEEQLSGPFADIRGVTSQTAFAERRLEWEQVLGAAKWSAIGWPEKYGGRNADLAQQVIFAEEYARARAPGRLGHMGVELAGPTILHFGNDAQRERFLPKMASGEEMWCQGYSEPGAGSDLSSVRTRATLEDGPDGERWVIEGQKIWTSLAQFAHWCFVICRTEAGSKGREGISYLLVPMDQPGIEIRPIRQMTGEADFNEVFFDGAVTAEENVVGLPGQGWQVAMGTLSFERGVSTLAQQMHFRNELAEIIDAANANGQNKNPLIRQKIAKAWRGLQTMRASALRMLSGAESGALSGPQFTYKIFWATWHRELGELAMEVLGQPGEIVGPDYELTDLSLMYLFSRADTIYAGTNQIQRNVISERALQMPKEPRG